MRRAALLTFCLGELLVAGVLVSLGYGLPSTGEIQSGFTRAGRVTEQASTQVDIFRRQVHTLRALELRALARRLKAQAQSLTHTLRHQPLDFAMVGTVRDAVGELAGGLGGLAESLDPAAAGRLGTGLGDSAAFLEEVAARTLPPAGPESERGQDPEALVKALAATLRQAARSIEATVTRWPELRVTLAKLAELLRAARLELDIALTRQKDYEEVLRQTVQLADGLAAVLPVLTDQLAGQLDQQDRALAELGQSIDEFGTGLPVYERSATQLLQAGKLLTWLMALIVLVHAVYLASGWSGAARENGRAVHAPGPA